MYCTWPESAGLSNHEADMLGALFHLTSQIEGRGEHKVRICLADLILGIEPLKINLGCSNGLLSGGHAFPQLDKLLR